MNRPPRSFTTQHPRFRIPGWRELLGEKEYLDAPDMVRHFLITGETGSGKSASAVMRLLEAVLRYPEPECYAEYSAATGAAAEPEETLRPAVLVVDPKHELQALVRNEARGRNITRITYGESGPILHMFEGRDLAQIDPGAAVDFILQQSDFFTKDQARTDDPIWNLQAASMIKDFVAVDMWLVRHGKLQEFWTGIAESFRKIGDYDNFIPYLKYDPANYFRAMATIIGLAAEGDHSNFALEVYLAACSSLSVPGELLVRITTVMNLAHTTRSSVVWMANGILADLSSEDLTSCISLNPIEPPPAERQLSVEETLNNGDAVIYVPTATTSIADLIGRCLKSKFFEFAFQRQNQCRPFFYIVDEAHRFITSGEQDGEQSLLDRCRAYRTGVVLATQSLASMAYRLGNAGGWRALQIMVNNCGNALYFRTSDIDTQDNLAKRIPNPPVPGRPHILAIRPLTSLAVGSCYALRSNGSWGMFQVHLPD